MARKEYGVKMGRNHVQGGSPKTDPSGPTKGSSSPETEPNAGTMGRAAKGMRDPGKTTGYKVKR